MKAPVKPHRDHDKSVIRFFLELFFKGRHPSSDTGFEEDYEGYQGYYDLRVMKVLKVIRVTYLE